MRGNSLCYSSREHHRFTGHEGSLIRYGFPITRIDPGSFKDSELLQLARHELSAYTRAFLFKPPSRTPVTSPALRCLSPALRCLSPALRCLSPALRCFPFSHSGATPFVHFSHLGVIFFLTSPLAPGGKMANNAADVIASEEHCRLLGNVQACC